MKALDLCHRAGITYRQLDYWSRVGYVHERNPGPGSGYSRDYDDTEVAVAMRMGALVRARVQVRDAASTARWMVEQIADTVTVTIPDAPDLTITYRYRPPGEAQAQESA